MLRNDGTKLMDCFEEVVMHERSGFFVFLVVSSAVFFCGKVRTKILFFYGDSSPIGCSSKRGHF